MNKLYEALEVCLNEIEQGADVDTVLDFFCALAVRRRHHRNRILERGAVCHAPAVEIDNDALPP